MELRLAFTELMFAFCAVVLADRVHGFSERVLMALGFVRPQKRPDTATRAGKHTSDWYVHFHRRTLTGDIRPRAIRSTPRSTSSTDKRARQDRRPRLWA